MSDDKKFSAPSTSKQIEPEEQDVYDVEKFIESELKKAKIKQDSTNQDRLVFFIVVLEYCYVNPT